MTIPVIDIFAGPGGLGEGFSSLRDSHGGRRFKIALSIEKDPIAHQTLQLRSFFRQFETGAVPEDYYAYLRGEIGMDELFKRHPDAAQKASEEALCAELGQHPWSDIDERINRAIGKSTRWVLIGGPPCQAYSLVGRSRMRKKNPQKFGRDKRHLLYREYLRIIAVHQPPVFVMENVKGMLSSKFKKDPIIRRILEDLREPEKALPDTATFGREPVRYQLHTLANYGTSEETRDGIESPEQFLLRCEEHGIPQARHRVILVGIRSDVKGNLKKLPIRKRVSMWQAIKDLPEMRSRLSDRKDSPESWVDEIRMICDCTVVPCNQFDHDLRRKLQEYSEKLTARRSTGGEYVLTATKSKWKTSWFYDPRLGGALNHSSRSHIPADLRRYFFAACFGRHRRTSPSITQFPSALLPEHKNLVNKPPDEIVFADRFRVQVAHKPATTITSHISKDGHYFIHPDPTQCRSLTVREAARLQTFPDNYYFVGPRTAQYHQVGNAVPPLIAREIARAIERLLSRGRVR